MANPTEKDEDQSVENTKGAFDKHECFVEKTIWGWKVKVGETCQFFEECVKETGCELKWWASMIKGILIVILVYFLLIVVYCGFYSELSFDNIDYQQPHKLCYNL